MKLKGLLSLLLAVMMLFSATSCGFIIINDLSSDGETEISHTEAPDDTAYESDDKYVKHEDDGSVKAEAESYLAELPERDYGGAVFFITTPGAEYIAPDDTSDAVSKLAYERNREVEELLGISIVTSVRSTDTMLEELKQAEASGSYYTDLLMVPVYMIGQYKIDDVLLNMRTIPFFDIDKPYFSKSSSDMTSGGYSTFGVAGYASISPSSFSAVYMNKTVLTEAGIDVDEIYRNAADGNWTWDTLLSYTAAVRTLNGTKQPTDAGFDGYYTLTAQNTAGRLADLIFKSSGNDFIITGRRKVPSIGYTVTSSKKTVQTIYDIYNDSCAITSETASAVTPFSEGRSAFLVDYLYVMEQLANSEADWGILPLPKGDESDEYRTLISNTELVFAIPKSHTNTEYAGITLSALNAASYGYIYDEYVNYSMMNYLRDNESIEMLDIILDTASFDFALAFGNVYPSIADATYKLIRDCAKTGDVEKYYRERTAEARKVMKENFDLVY